MVVQGRRVLESFGREAVFDLDFEGCGREIVFS